MNENYVKNPHLTPYSVFYIHNILLSMYNGLFEWFTKSYFDDFKFKTMSTHDKAQEEIKKFKLENKDIEQPYLPAINFNPFGDITVEEEFANLWRQRWLGPHMAQRILSSDPDYIDDNFEFYIVYEGYTGNAELILWLSSLSEYLDHRLYLLNWFHGGFNRRVRINNMPLELILPKELVEYPFQDQPYDWSNSQLSRNLIATMNKELYVYPVIISPQIWLTSLSDASQIYGEDDISSYKIQVTFQYSVKLPSYVIVKSNLRPKYLRLYMRFSKLNLSTLDTKLMDYNENERPLDEDNFIENQPYVDWQKLNVPEQFIPYMDIYMNVNEICSGNNFVFERIISYEFEQDTAKDSVIDISSFDIHNYNQIILGDRQKRLVEGEDYKLEYDENNQIYTNIVLLKDIEQGTIWDIVLYRKE